VINKRRIDSMKLKLWLPDTIVFGDGNLTKAWFYSNNEGCVCRTDNFTARHIVAKLGNWGATEELVAVSKKPYIEKRNMTGNVVSLVSTRDLGQLAYQLINNGGSTQVLQKFVKSCGPKAFICRTHWIDGEETKDQVIPRNKKKSRKKR
jgi:hypothetical protein